jgi:phage gpG-like protein
VTVSVRGDFAAAASLARRLSRLSDQAVTDVVKAVAAEAQDLVAEGFRRSTAPGGVPWRPLARARKRNARRGDRGKPLLDTGRLRASVTTRPRIEGDSFSITANPVYAATHQYGFGAIPARPFLPIPELPPSWRRAFILAADEAIEALL